MVDGWLADATLSEQLRLGVIIGLTVVLTLFSSRWLPSLIRSAFSRLASSEVQSVYQKIIVPCQSVIIVAIALLIAEVIVWLLPRFSGYSLLEIPISLSLTIALSWLASRLFKQIFQAYLLDAALRKGRKANTELLILGRFFANFSIVVLAIIVFAQTHQVNIFGLVASLGIGGLAIAFAAQKTLEQLLGGIVIYLDRPFVVDDYIGLPDNTFGRVESIGLRSTKVRTSGKGTLVIIPNSSLTQVSIENFTGAKKVMSIVYLNFSQTLPEEETALIRQVILESTNNIFGIDSRNTDVAFRDLANPARTQAQITFFILGSGEVSMELRRQLLDIANQNITQKLKQHGIVFDIEGPTIYVDSPITI